MITRNIAWKLNNGIPVKKIRDDGNSEKGMGRIVEKQQNNVMT